MFVKSVPLSIGHIAKNSLQVKALRAAPKEACGIITKDGHVIELPNLADGDHDFQMEIDRNDDNIACVWHSHPRGPNWPSRSDIPCMEAAYEAGLRFGWIIVVPGHVFQYTLLDTLEE